MHLYAFICLIYRNMLAIRACVQSTYRYMQAEMCMLYEEICKCAYCMQTCASYMPKYVSYMLYIYMHHTCTNVQMNNMQKYALTSICFSITVCICNFNMQKYADYMQIYAKWEIHAINIHQYCCEVCGRSPETRWVWPRAPVRPGWACDRASGLLSSSDETLNTALQRTGRDSSQVRGLQCP